MIGNPVDSLYHNNPRGHEPCTPEWTADREAVLDRWVAAGKLVPTLDDISRPEPVTDADARSLVRDCILYVTVRSLGYLCA